MEQHNYDVQHDCLHAVEANKVMELLVFNDRKEHDEENDKGGKLGREIKLCQWSRDEIKDQKIAESSVNLAAKGNGVNPRDEVAESCEHAPEKGGWALVSCSVTVAGVKCVRVVGASDSWGAYAASRKLRSGLLHCVTEAGIGCRNFEERMGL